MAVCSGGKRLLGGQDGLGWMVSNLGLSLRALLSEKIKEEKSKIGHVMVLTDRFC